MPSEFVRAFLPHFSSFRKLIPFQKVMVFFLSYSFSFFTVVFSCQPFLVRLPSLVSVSTLMSFFLIPNGKRVSLNYDCRWRKKKLVRQRIQYRGLNILSLSLLGVCPEGFLRHSVSVSLPFVLFYIVKLHHDSQRNQHHPDDNDEAWRSFDFGRQRAAWTTFTYSSFQSESPVDPDSSSVRDIKQLPHPLSNNSSAVVVEHTFSLKKKYMRINSCLFG